MSSRRFKAVEPPEIKATSGKATARAKPTKKKPKANAAKASGL
jgi:hypothetical protein